MEAHVVHAGDGGTGAASGRFARLRAVRALRAYQRSYTAKICSVFQILEYYKRCRELRCVPERPSRACRWQSSPPRPMAFRFKERGGATYIYASYPLISHSSPCVFLFFEGGGCRFRRFQELPAVANQSRRAVKLAMRAPSDGEPGSLRGGVRPGHATVRHSPAGGALPPPVMAEGLPGGPRRRAPLLSGHCYIADRACSAVHPPPALARGKTLATTLPRPGTKAFKVSDPAAACGASSPPRCPALDGRPATYLSTLGHPPAHAAHPSPPLRLRHCPPLPSVTVTPPLPAVVSQHLRLPPTVVAAGDTERPKRPSPAP